MPTVAIVVLFMLQLADVRHGVMSMGRQPDWNGTLPALVATADLRRPHLFPADMVVVGILESLMLLLIVRRDWKKRADLFALFAGCGVMLALALASTSITSNDMYAYIGYAHLPGVLDAYHPPNAPLPGPFRPINTIWHQPLVPCAYGPLWLAWNWCELHWAPNLAAALLTLRTVNAGALLLLGWIVSRLAGRRAASLVLLNPALIFEFVVNAHNDLLAVVLLSTGLLASRRSTFAGAILGGLAASMKLPFTVLAVGALAITGPLKRRLTTLFVIAAFGLGSLLVGDYPRALATVAQINAVPHDTLRSWITLLVHAAVGGFAFIGVALLVLTQRRPRMTAWCLSCISVASYAWYAVWGLPSAMATRVTIPFLVVLPFFALMADYAFPSSALIAQTAILILALAEIIGIARVARPEQRMGWRTVPTPSSDA